MAKPAKWLEQPYDLVHAAGKLHDHVLQISLPCPDYWQHFLCSHFFHMMTALHSICRRQLLEILDWAFNWLTGVVGRCSQLVVESSLL